MSNLQKFGVPAAWLNALVAIATLLVAFVWIGPAALTDRTQFVELALHNPAPLIAQDVLKYISAAIGFVLLTTLFYRLRGAKPTLTTIATAFGALSILCLLSNASLSLVATTQAAQLSAEQGNQLNGLIGGLGLAAIFINGPWYLCVSWAGLKSGQLPKGLSYLGLVMGGLSLLPFLGIFVLLLSIAWSVWLGQVLMKTINHQDTKALS